MHDKFVAMSSPIYEYLVDHRSDRDPIAAELIAETEKLGGLALMQIAPEQGSFMALLARSIGAKRAIEVGTFTGYSALAVARALPDDGKLICCDVSEEWTSIGRKYWGKAGVAHKIDLRIAPAVETLRALPNDPVFDFAFVDADKPNYRNYYEEIITRLRPGGLVLFDNVLWMGQVIDANSKDESTVALRELNDFIRDDSRVESVMLSISDGLTIARKR